MKLFFGSYNSHLTHYMVVRAPNSRRHTICFIGPEKLLRGAVNFLLIPLGAFRHTICTGGLQCLLMRLTLHVCIGLLPQESMSNEFCKLVYCYLYFAIGVGSRQHPCRIALFIPIFEHPLGFHLGKYGQCTVYEN